MQASRKLRDALTRLRDGTISLEEAEREIDGFRIEEVGDIACIDIGRTTRCGIPEVVLAEGKESAHLSDIALAHARSSGRCIVSRINRVQATTLRERAEQDGFVLTCHDAARMAVLSMGPQLRLTGGL